MVTVATILVEEKPRVTLSVDPATAINEMLNANVTLMCLSDRDERFMAVKWYLDGELLKVGEEIYNKKMSFRESCRKIALIF